MSDESHGSEPRKDVEQAESQQSTSPKESDRNPASGGLPRSEDPFDLEPSPSHPQETHNKGKYGIKWWKDRLEIVGLVAGIIVAFLLYGQWKEMVKATKATLESVEISKGQMAVMKRQLDDAEAQQRAVLEFGQFTVKRIANLGKNDSPDMLTIKVSYTIKNVGYTPAIDLAAFGESFPDDEFDKRLGFTNTLKKWDHSKPPNPSPNGMGLIGIMPQETITNGNFTIGEPRKFMDNFYLEHWISYKDIFWHSWIIGEGGHYDITNDLFVPEFIYSGQYRQQDQTNSTP